MKMEDTRKKVRIFLHGFKFEGTLLENNIDSYVIDDIKDGKVVISKYGAIMKILEDDGGEEN